MKSLFEVMKKRFPIQLAIGKFRDLVAKSKYETIWMPNEERDPIKMNAEFILMYLLHNSDQQLRIELMSLVKNTMTLPLHFREFTDIMNVSDSLALNEDLIWVMKSGITICSVGLHTLEGKDK